MIEVAGFRPPIQDRSKETLGRIVDAAAQLLYANTLEDLTVDEILELAGSSKGAFYARFDDKDALFRYLYEHWSRRGKEQWMAFFSDPTRRTERAHDLVRAIVSQLVGIYQRDRDCLRAFTLRARMPNEPEATARASEMNEFVLTMVESSLARHSDELGHPDPRSAARFGMMAVGAVAREFVLFGNERLRHSDWDDERLIAELTALFTAYLRLDPTPDSRDGQGSDG